MRGAEDVYAIDQLQAMRLIDEAWKNVSSETIAHCWHKVGILSADIDSGSPSKGSHLETVENCDQEAALAEIKDCYEEFNRIRPHHAQLSIEEPVSPTGENDAIALENLKDNEIIDYVLKNRGSEQGVVNSDDDSNSDWEQEVRPTVSIDSALDAIKALNNFMELEDGQVFRNATRELVNVERVLRKRIQDGQKQKTITSFFSMSPPIHEYVADTSNRLNNESEVMEVDEQVTSGLNPDMAPPLRPKRSAVLPSKYRY